VIQPRAPRTKIESHRQAERTGGSHCDMSCRDQPGGSSGALRKECRPLHVRLIRELRMNSPAFCFFSVGLFKNQAWLEGGAALKNRDGLVRGDVMERLDNAGRPANLQIVDAISIFQSKDLDQAVLGLVA
jgi:hypothetical protein